MQRIVKCASAPDLELGEDVAQVHRNCSMRQKQSLADLLVGQTAGGQPSDPLFLRGKSLRPQSLAGL
jgi:hypothetical protein